MTTTRTGLRARPKAASAKTTLAPAIDAELVRALAQLLSDTDLAELEIERGDLRIKLVRHNGMVAMPTPAAPAVVVTQATPVAATPSYASEAPAEHPGTVKSPMVGTVYRRANPESKPFVEVGATVRSGEKLLLVEAMKTFNEIVAPRAGTVSAILIEDGQPVEFGQPLLVIE